MTAHRTLLAPTASAAPALAGAWKLAAGRAVTLKPKEAGVLRVAHGRFWATFDGPHDGPPNAQGDLVLGVGQSIRVEPGQRIVVEAWDRAGASYFSWDPAPAKVAVPAVRQVMQPLADLRLALWLAGSAVGRLAGALVRLGWASVVPPRRPVARVQCGA